MDLTLKISVHTAKYTNTATAIRYANTFLNVKSAHLFQLFLPHLTTWQSFCEKCCQKGDHYQGRSPGFKSGQMQRDCAEFLHKQSPLLRTLMDGPQPSPIPASYLALPLILSSSSGLIHWVPVTLLPLFLSFPSLPWAWSHVHILHNKPRRMSTEQKQRG